jgi:hypothetical protein
MTDTPKLPWCLAPHMPLHQPHDATLPEPVIIDQGGRFVADFGYHDGSMANAKLVMDAVELAYGDGYVNLLGLDGRVIGRVEKAEAAKMFQRTDAFSLGYRSSREPSND